jgi:2-polyprenyl-3-methyl-5-hydroxy-6-metoxy-1,4-benzoquinol methylase
MSKFLNVIKWGATLGKEPQSFLSAKWIETFLKRVREKKKRIWALRIVSLSPHYFINPENPAYHGMSNDEYLEANFDLLAKSRQEVYRKILKPYLEKDFTVLDYGCGPGFLAKATASHVKKIYAIDISTGAIACAKIINSAENIEYVTADKLDKVPDREINAVYSFAVVQHVTDEIFELILENCQKKLKPGGILILHIQLQDEIWQTEKDWKEDRSIKGKIKYQYGLHCFGRTENEYVETVAKHNFNNIHIEKIIDFVHTDSNEIHSQRLLIARKIS